MKERFDLKTQDIFLYISGQELEYLLGPGGLEGLRLVNDEKKVFFLLFRGSNEDAERETLISVHAEYNRTSQTSGESGYTDFFIRLSPQACKDLKVRGLSSDRYLGKTGLERVMVFVGEPEQVR